MKKNLSHIKKTALVSALLLEMTAIHAATTINVDGTTCTLADAITAANTDTATGGCTAGAYDDVLELDIAGSPFTQTAQLPIITSNVTINGNGSVVARDLASPEFPVVYIDGGNAVLNDLTITGGSATNTATNYGGGVVVQPASAVEINNSIISGNNGGAVWLYNTTGSSINNSVIENNTSNPGRYYTGGVSINGGYLDINNSTITGNNNVATGAGGGGLYVTDYGAATTVGVSNSTISGNTAAFSGGGIATASFGSGIELNLNSATVTLNSTSGNGGGIHNNGGDVAVSQSLLSGNTAAAANQWEATGGAYITVDSYNIFGESSVSGLVGVTPGGTDVTPTEAVADIFDTTLADNGGPTPTHALVVSGPAVDAIPGGNCLMSTDQTGKSRPQDGDGDLTADCDVGAFENDVFDLIFKDGF